MLNKFGLINSNVIFKLVLVFDLVNICVRKITSITMPTLHSIKTIYKIMVF